MNCSKVNMEAEENVMKYDLMVSLKHVSAVNVVTQFLNLIDIQQQLLNLEKEGTFCIDKRYDQNKFCQKVKDKVLEWLSQLHVPKCIIKIVSNIVFPMMRQIFSWHNELVERLTLYESQPKPQATTYIKYIVWTPRGTIDYKETFKIVLAKEKELSDLRKYIIACNYCLEDSIAFIAPKVQSFAYLKSLHEWNIWEKILVLYWNSHMTEDFTKLDKAIRYKERVHGIHYSRNEYVFNTLINHSFWCKNEIGIKYIWNKLTKEEKSRQIVQAITKTDNNDIKCFLLSKISKQQQIELINNGNSEIPLCFLGDWLWGQYFLYTIHNIWYIMSENNFVEVLEGILNKMDKDIENYYQYTSIFKELWNCASEHFKEYVVEYGYGRIGCVLFCKKYIDLVLLILPYIVNSKQKQYFSSHGIEICKICLTSNKWNLLKLFIGNNNHFPRNIVDQVKQGLVEAEGKNIVLHFIQNKERDNFEKFMEWAFTSNDEQKSFKLNLSYSICAYILKSFVVNNTADFLELEYFLKWCASGSEERIIEFKVEILRLNFKDVLSKLIERNQYEMFDKILSWCFDNDQNQGHERDNLKRFTECAFTSNDEQKSFKLNLRHSICAYILKSFVVNNTADFSELEYFLKWCASGSEERIIEFKVEIPRLYFKDVLSKLIERNEYEMFHKILSWCFDNDQNQVHECEQDIYMYYNERFVFEEFIANLIKQDYQWKSLKKFFRWRFPNEQEVAIKEYIFPPTKCIECICIELFRNDMFKLADEFVNWVFSSTKRGIDEFKSEVMTCELLGGSRWTNRQKVEIIKWFNPSIDKIIIFKEKYLTCWWSKDILQEIDKYVYERKHNKDTVINRDVSNILNDLLAEVECQVFNINDNDLRASPTGVTAEDKSVL